MKLCIKRINGIDKTLQALGSTESFNDIYKRTIVDIVIGIIYMSLLIMMNILSMDLTDQSIHNTYKILVLFIYLYWFMVKFLLVIEFLTIVRYVMILIVQSLSF